MSTRMVYVDSGSADASVALSRNMEVVTVELDRATHFTAARARNAGYDALLAAHPLLRYVFFVDGDCEVVPGWIETAVDFLERNAKVAVVWGRRRERYPEKSVYNMLCDLQWADYPFGETKACGGDAVIRVAAFEQVRGYRADLICGEEPELCVRLRQHGWRIWRLNHDMTLHDAALYRFGQWWTRSRRAGYAYVQGVYLHGAAPEQHFLAESRRAWIWGLLIPLVTVLLALTVSAWAALLLVAYPLSVVRLAVQGRRSRRENWWRAGTLVLGKFPEMLGQVGFLRDRVRNAPSRLIEYK